MTFLGRDAQGILRDYTVEEINEGPGGGEGGGGSDDQTAAEVPFTPAGSIAATNVQAAIEEVAAEASGLPSQWTDGGNGDVTATTDDDTTPLTVVAPESGSDGPYAIRIEPAGPAWTGGIYVSTGDATALQGNAYVIRVYDEVNARQLFDIDAWGSMLLKAPASGGGGFVVEAGNDVGVAYVFKVIADETVADSSIAFFGSGGATQRPYIDPTTITPEEIGNILIAFGLMAGPDE